MIKGFEEHTYELREQELKGVLPIVVSLLSQAKGRDKAINSIRLLQLLSDRNIHTNDTRIRKMIQYIRHRKILRGLIAAGVLGYFVSNNPSEIRQYADESYGSRIRAMQEIKDSILEDAQYFETQENCVI